VTVRAQGFGNQRFQRLRIAGPRRFGEFGLERGVPGAIGFGGFAQPRQIGGHQRRHAKRAAQAAAPGIGQIERAEQRGKQADIADPDFQPGCAKRTYPIGGKRQGSRIVFGLAGAADRFKAGFQTLRRAGRLAAKDQPLIGVTGGTAPGGQMMAADGNGEIGPETKPFTGSALGDEDAAADILASGLQKRLDRVQDGQIEPGRAGLAEEPRQSAAGFVRCQGHRPVRPRPAA